MIGTLIDQINLLSLNVRCGGIKFLAGEEWGVDEVTTDTELDSAFAQVMYKLQQLIDEIWVWVVVALAAVVVIWGAYIGIRIAIAHRNEDKINSRDMLKNLLIGIIVMFVVALGVPLIITALNAWVG